MGSPWTTEKKLDSVKLTPSKFCPLDEGIDIDTVCYATVTGNMRLDIKATKSSKVDVYLNRESSNNNTGWQSYSVNEGFDGIFYIWATWMGEVQPKVGYRWYIRLNSGLTGAVTTRYTKGSILYQPSDIKPSPDPGLSTLVKFGTDD